MLIFLIRMAINIGPFSYLIAAVALKANDNQSKLLAVKADRFVFVSIPPCSSCLVVSVYRADVTCCCFFCFFLVDPEAVSFRLEADPQPPTLPPFPKSNQNDLKSNL